MTSAAQGCFSLAREREGNQFVEETGAHVAVPLVGLSSRFGATSFRSKPTIVFPDAHDLTEDEDRLRELEPAGNRRTGVRAIARIETVDVERDPDLVRERRPRSRARSAANGSPSIFRRVIVAIVEDGDATRPAMSQ